MKKSLWMRKVGWVSGAAIMFAAGMQVATATPIDIITFQFTTTQGGPAPSPVTGVWVGYGGATRGFSDFTVNWNGVAINLAGNNAASNVSLSGLLGGGQWCAAGIGYTGNAICPTGARGGAQPGSFSILPGPAVGGSGEITNLFPFFGGGSNFAGGTFTATETIVDTATPIDITFHFTTTQGGPAPTSPVTGVWVGYGGATRGFSVFTVNWNGVAINLAGNNAASNVSLSGLLGGGQWCAAGIGYTGNAICPTGARGGAQPGSFSILPGPVVGGSGEITNLFPFFGGGSNFAGGTFTATATSVTAVPEPSSLGMMLLGLGALVFFWFRRRDGLSRQLPGSRQL